MSKRGVKRLGERETAELREAFELFDNEKSGKINLRGSGARRSRVSGDDARSSVRERFSNSHTGTS